MVEKQRLHMIGLSLAALLALGAVMSATALAATDGPSWLFNGAMLTGEKQTILAKNIGAIKFKGPGGVNIACQKSTTAGQTTQAEILGTDPGQTVAEIEMSECTLEGKNLTECSVTSAGQSTKGIVKVYTDAVLVYPLNKAKEMAEALNALVPVNGSLFAETTLEGTKCTPVPNKTVVNLEANGTNITEPTFNKKCGILAQIGEITMSNTFKLLAAATPVEHGGLNFPATAIAEGELSLSNGTFLKITCELQAKSGFVSGKTTEIGVMEVFHSLMSTLGWTNK